MSKKTEHFEVDFLEKYDEESILAELRRLAAALGKPNVSALDLAAGGRVKYHTVVREFGSLRRALERAGLRPSRCTKVSDAEVIGLIADLWRMTLREHGRRPRANDLMAYDVPVSAQTIAKRFGSWKRALIATARLEADGAVPEARASGAADAAGEQAVPGAEAG